MNTPKLKFDVAQAYLEMARAFHGIPIVAPRGMTMTNNTAFALSAHGFVFSHMAINAFVSACLWKVWQMPHSKFKAKYPNRKNFKHLLKTDLKELKDCILELCLHLELQPLHKADSKLWDDLLQIVKITRDFMTHPTPDEDDFNRIIGDVMNKYTWGQPAQIAERVIRYFYTGQMNETPKWLEKNQEFCFNAICALSVQPKIS